MVCADLPARPARSCRLGELRAAIIADCEPQITLALQVAVLLAAGYRRAEIARRLDCSPPEVDTARRWLRRAARRLDLGDDARGPRASGS
jgi:hypothetical protein